MNKEFEEKVNKLSMIEQNSQYLASQRQNFQTQLIEIESALEELDTSSDSYKIIGNVMVKSDKETLKKELIEKKNIIDVRIKSIEKQEDKIKNDAKELREEVMKGLEDSKAEKGEKK